MLPKMLGSTTGQVLSSLLVVAIMAAAMSTADSNLHALSALLTRDIYHRFVRPTASERERVQIGRLVILGATLSSLLLVLWGSRPDSGLEGFMQMIVNMALFAVAFSVQLLPMTIDVLFVRRGTKSAAIGGLIAGLLVAFCFTSLLTPLMMRLGFDDRSLLLQLIANSKALFPVHASAWGLLANAIVFISLTTMRRNAVGDGDNEST